MSLLVLDVSSEIRNLPVPEIDLIPVLASTLIKQAHLPLKLLTIEISLSYSFLKLSNSINQSFLICVVCCTNLSHPLLLSLKLILLLSLIHI
jgi:hypothetical protein